MWRRGWEGIVYGEICTLGGAACAGGEPGWKDRDGPAQPSLTAVYPHPALIQPPNVLHCLAKKRGAGKASPYSTSNRVS